MNIFKKKSLCAALAGIGVLGAAGAAQAVNLNPDGLGQVLIYPYYTTRNDGNGNAFNSLLSVVNTTASVKAVKVRFLEGKNSREVLDFNLFLSPKDVWTGAVVPTGNGGAGLATNDVSCTIPKITPDTVVPFVNFAYTADGADSSLDRTQEGYAEIIEMGTFADDSQTAANVTHVDGVPPGCFPVETDAIAASEVLPPTGGLFGGMTLINVQSGSDYTEDAVALDNFSDVANYNNAGSIQPDLTKASPPQSVVFANGFVYTSFWAPGTADPVSAVLMHDHIMNEYVLDTSTQSGTDWVVTMPTKRYYVQNGTGTPPTLFQRNFNKTDGACDDIDAAIFDREEQTTTTPLNFSPPPPSGAPLALCWEANVITFNDSNVLGSKNFQNIPPDQIPGEHGWLDVNLASAAVPAPIHTLQSADTFITDIFAFFTEGPATYVGLPVVGFAVQSFTNGVLIVNGQATLSDYGGNFAQKGTRNIQAVTPVEGAATKKSMRSK